MVYLIFIAAISIFYLDMLQKYDKEILSADKELRAVAYLDTLHKISNDIFIYQENITYYNANQQMKNKLHNTLLENIKLLNTYKEVYSEFNNAHFNKQLILIQHDNTSFETYYQFFDYVNHENYRIGDVSELFFVNDRKLHFLVSLITHYLPEFSISLMLTHHIAEEYLQTGSISDKKKSIFIEQNKLIRLSFDETMGIVKLLNKYEDTHILETMMNEIDDNIQNLTAANADFLDLTLDENKFAFYLGSSHILLELVKKLQEQNSKLLEDNLIQHKKGLEDKILLYHLLIAFIIILVSVIFIYLYILYKSNRDKDSQIQAKQRDLEFLNSSLQEQSDNNYIKATHDTLTGLKNRVFFNESLPSMFTLAQREKTPLSIIFLDVDFFKKINDTHGHLIGDIVLKHIAMLIAKDQRKSDLFARWGGEEFVILLPNTKKEDAVKVAELLRKKISSNLIEPLTTLTVSFGVTSLQEGDDQDTLVNRADEALLRAKEDGRDRVYSL